jgi:hypothetical protein
MSKQKRKGSSLEREIAKFLSEKYSTSFLRVNGSGAYIGGTNVSRMSRLTEDQIRNARGDIAVPPDFSRLNIEAKSYAEFSWHQLYTQCKQIDKWLAQMIEVADSTSVNVLIFKITRRGTYICVENKYDWIKPPNYTVYKNTIGDWLICDMDLFFENNTEKFKELSKPV